MTFGAMSLENRLNVAREIYRRYLARGDDVVPIPGTRRIDHLEDDLAAATVIISPDTVAEVEAMFDGTIHGARYNAAMQAQIDTETFADEALA